MKNLIKKQVVLFSLLLLLATDRVYAAKSRNEPLVQVQKADYAGVATPKRNLLVHGYCKAYHIPSDLCFFIRCLVYDNPFKYRNKTLPNDLSGQDLRGYDFTGCAFTHTNLTDTNLAGVILTHTTCDYQKAFQDNIKKNKLEGGHWYQENLPNDLKSIAEVYLKLDNDAHKAKLLHIACSLSRLPFDGGEEFHIKAAYWSYVLLRFKQTLGKPLLCSLQGALKLDGRYYSWTSQYPRKELDDDDEAPHADFAKYLKSFHDGIKRYNCKAFINTSYYKENITLSIQGLKKVYTEIKDEQLKKEARNIAYGLAKSYQFSQMLFLFRYLFFQHRLIQLKNSVGVGVENKILYRRGLYSYLLFDLECYNFCN